MSVRLILYVLLCAVTSMAARADRPNVVIVMTDDQGYGDLSCHGNPVLRTPHLDKLHGESTRLTDYHVSPTCSPTRAALLTGHWSNRTGVWHTIMGRSMIRASEITLGQLFQDAGYATGMFGKWHLGDNYPFRPEDRGFGEILRHGGGGVGQTPDFWDNAYFDGSYWHNGKPVPVTGFCTDVFFDYAKRFIRQQKAADQPFLVYIATNAPHGPMHAPEESAARYSHLKNTSLQHFYGMIVNIDDNVGALRAFLEEEGLAQDTIFIFTTDNGTSSGADVHNSGMRGRKGSQYDGGHRVPFFFHWPAGGYSAGQDIDVLTAHVDVVPTLLRLCNVSVPVGLHFDGIDLTGVLSGKAASLDRLLVTDSQRVKDPIKWRKSSVMGQRWRLIDGKELYDIQHDPGQKSDVAGNHPDVVSRLRAFYDQWWEELLPTFQQPALIEIGNPAENPSRLTSHDWITTRMTPWNQHHIRSAMNGPSNTGYWNVQVSQAGEYEFRLRRWPAESGLAIEQPLAPGGPVPGVRPFRATPGKAIRPVSARLRIGQSVHTSDVEPGSQDVVFRVPVEAGRTQVEAVFISKDGTEYGCYYAYVTALSAE